MLCSISWIVCSSVEMDLRDNFIMSFSIYVYFLFCIVLYFVCVFVDSGEDEEGYFSSIISYRCLFDNHGCTFDQFQISKPVFLCVFFKNLKCLHQTTCRWIFYIKNYKMTAQIIIFTEENVFMKIRKLRPLMTLNFKKLNHRSAG